MSFEDYFARLFGIATGWLGWSPNDAWEATPAEILAAQAGRTELLTTLLQAVLGKPEEETLPASYSPERLAHVDALGFDPSFDRDGLMALKANSGAI